MSTIPVIVKWQGKKIELDLDLAEPATLFKSQLYSMTGVEPERQKILIKGGQLRDDTDLKTLGIKSGHSFMMIGSAGELLKAPEKKTIFVEDMTDAELARSIIHPAGLVNLGNTCYMNATLQTLRIMPELQAELANYKGQAALGVDPRKSLTAAFRDLNNQMNRTTEPFSPFVFLNVLRLAVPQFAERARDSNVMAQQDAEEAWTQILQTLRTHLTDASDPNSKSFVDKYMSGTTVGSIVSPELPDDPPQIITESFIKLDCHISVTTNFLRDGILGGLSEKMEKRSDALDRDAVFEKTSRISRLPKYLTIHLVRFFWRRDIQKKTKILRQVKFPIELDATEFCTEDLKKKLVPVRDRVREMKKKLEEQERAKKRARYQQEVDGNSTPSTIGGTNGSDQDKKEDNVDIDKDKEPPLVDLIDKDLAADEGNNQTGLYELCGVLTHAGPSASSGHWQSWVKQPVGDDWWQFNDAKVFSVPQSKIESLDGGGEADAAYILLYKAKDIPDSPS